MTHAHKHVYPPALNPQAMHVEKEKIIVKCRPTSLKLERDLLSEAQFKV